MLTECGDLLWSDICHKQNVDPFSEHHGDRHDLLNRTLELIEAESYYNEPIVVQGIAGQGKSSFTKRLCVELLERGFIPLRVQLKNLRFSGALWDSIGRALELDDEDSLTPARELKEFRLEARHLEIPHGTHTEISRYVLILDGWDELSVQEKSFQERVNETMSKIRAELLGSGRKLPLRVVVTGRPNPTVEKSELLDPERTHILTMRNLRPEQLTDFIKRIAAAQADTQKITSEDSVWRVLPLDIFQETIKGYRKAFEATLPKKKENDSNRKLSGEWEVLGSPLLTYLVVRLMSEAAAVSKTDADKKNVLAALIKEPTRLYRHLTDLVVEHGAKAPMKIAGPTEIARQNMPRVDPKDIRQKLRLTAAAMSVLGQDTLSEAEWQERLPETLTQATPQDKSPFVTLIISFFFKSQSQQNQLRVEFTHKSFREYLFAEEVVERLKAHGAAKPDACFSLDPKQERVRDFDPVEHPSQFQLSRELAKVLAPQWLTTEIIGHLDSLLRWEIDRATQGALTRQLQAQDGLTLAPLAKLGAATVPLTLDDWQNIRDNLAEVWTWWCEALHLRPQVNDKSQSLLPPYAFSLIDEEIREKGRTWKGQKPPTFPEIDAHLGDALSELTARVHYYLARAEGWDGRWLHITPPAENTAPNKRTANSPKDKHSSGRTLSPLQPGPLRSQSQLALGDNIKVVLFEPSGEPIADVEEDQYLPWGRNTFRNILNRISATSGRNNGEYPAGAFLSGVDLRHAPLYLLLLASANLNSACLDGATFVYAYLHYAELDGASLKRARLDFATLGGTHLKGANLNYATLQSANLNEVNLSEADLSNAGLSGVSLSKANLEGANFNNAYLDKRSEHPAIFTAVRGLTAEQLYSLKYLDESTILPDDRELQEAKNKIVALQKERKALEAAKQANKGKPDK